MKNKPLTAKRVILRIYISLSVAVALLFNIATTIYYFIKYGIVYNIPIVVSNNTDLNALLISKFVIILSSLLISIPFAFFLYRFLVSPILELNEKSNMVENGNYDVEIKQKPNFKIIRNTQKNFNKMTKSLRSVEILKSDFVSNVSHEIKTPLSAIEGYAELLKTDNLSPEEQKDCVDKILKNTKLLTTLSQDILAITRYENQQIADNKILYRLDEQIKKIIIFLEPKWQTKSISFNLDLEEITIFANNSVIYHIWYNIISNALKFSDDNSTIDIDLKSDKMDAIVTIRDYGIGMTEEQQKHIFEKFYQADPSRHEEGNGLGLALVKNILTLYKSDIKVESELGKGSTFTVTLKSIIP